MTTQASALPGVDMAGLGFSALCVIHCLALPLAASILPIAGVIAEMEAVHQALVGFAALAAGVGLVQGPARVRALFAMTAGAGVALLTVGAFVEAFHDFETPLTLTGAAILAGAHILRWRAATGGAWHAQP